MHHFYQYQVPEEKITTRRNQGNGPHVAIKLPHFEVGKEIEPSLENTFQVRQLARDCGTGRIRAGQAQEKNTSIKLNSRPLKTLASYVERTPAGRTISTCGMPSSM
jgi:hypothetical protein